MAVAWVVDDAGVFKTCSFKGTTRFGINTFGEQKVYFKFDLTGSGLTAGGIDTVVLRVYCSSAVGTTATRLTSGSGGDNWGANLDGNQTEFDSTEANIESNKSINSTGWKEYTVDKNNLDLNGLNYFKIFFTGSKVVGTNVSARFNSDDNGTNPPVLRITLASSGQVINIISS